MAGAFTPEPCRGVRALEPAPRRARDLEARTVALVAFGAGTGGLPPERAAQATAEGRLVLTDALCYARRYRPAAVVDLATLTGAVSVALGTRAAGLFANDEDLAAELSAAAALSGERLWPLPAWDEYVADMRSEVADLVNSSGTREGGAILGTVFLKHFARGLKWAHLDIAGTAWTDADRPHEPRGPTGFGVRLLLEWLSRRASGPVSRAS